MHLRHTIEIRINLILEHAKQDGKSRAEPSHNERENNRYTKRG